LVAILARRTDALAADSALVANAAAALALDARVARAATDGVGGADAVAGVDIRSDETHRATAKTLVDVAV